MNFKKRKIVIATGGTGGHVFPAYSLAKYFVDNKILPSLAIILIIVKVLLHSFNSP